MTIDTNTMISITEANQNFSKVTKVVDEHGTAVILKNNVPRYLVISKMIILSKEQILQIHTSLIGVTGGSGGIRDEGMLDSALNNPFQSFGGKELKLVIKKEIMMIVYLTSRIGGSYKKNGTRIPTQLSSENGLLDSLQKRWKHNSKVLIISADADNNIYPICSKSYLCTYEFGAVYRCFREKRQFFKADSIKHYDDYPIWFSISINSK